MNISAAWLRMFSIMRDTGQVHWRRHHGGLGKREQPRGRPRCESGGTDGPWNARRAAKLNDG